MAALGDRGSVCIPMSVENPINHDQAPQPHDKAVPRDEIKELDQAIDYVLAGFHVCVDKVAEGGNKAEGWNTAGWAYFNAYSGLIGLRGIEGDHVPKALELVHTADDEADAARKG